jgi:uncharacterized protein YbbC (DUF1343 family)
MVLDLNKNSNFDQQFHSTIANNVKEFIKKALFIALCMLIVPGLTKGQTTPDSGLRKTIQESKYKMPPSKYKTRDSTVLVAAARINLYKPVLWNKRVAVVANQTSMVGKVHLVDTLLKLGADIKVIFCPEHGFRGNEDAGKSIKNGKDEKTGIPIISLYGKKKKPSVADLAGIDVVLYDIQDVGVRFYTYISTLTYVMQACAENLKLLMILDRPDPNGFYVDGPVLDLKYKSFVGLMPIPLVYGMTPGELATMINEEGWLPNHLECSLAVIPCLNYTHKTLYKLPVNPSPNLKNMQAIYLYPSLGIFEGTVMNVGRGTDFPFQVLGHPKFADTTFRYIPHGPACTNFYIPHRGQVCYGVDLRGLTEEELTKASRIDLHYLFTAWKNYPDKTKFFNPFFENLVGTGDLRKQLMAGVSEDSIRSSWQPLLMKFKETRKKYLRYDDFE